MKFTALIAILSLVGCVPTTDKRVDRIAAAYCVVEVTITTEGNARDPKIVECNPQGKGFEEASLQNAAELKYNPKIENGKAVEVPGVLYRYECKVAET